MPDTNAGPAMNGKGPIPPELLAAASAQPAGPVLELEGGRKVALTSEEALRLELLETQTRLFELQLQTIQRARQEANTRGQEIIAAAIERDRLAQEGLTPL